MVRFVFRFDPFKVALDALFFLSPFLLLWLFIEEGVIRMWIFLSSEVFVSVNSLAKRVGKHQGQDSFDICNFGRYINETASLPRIEQQHLYSLNEGRSIASRINKTSPSLTRQFGL